MKKIVSLLLVLVMMLGLVACGASKPAETEAPATEAPVVTEAPATEAPETEAALVVDTMILKEADDKMLNTYSVIAVNPDASFKDADGNVVGTKVGKASAVNVLGIVATGDASINAAAKDAGIKKISHVDQEEVSVLGLFSKVTTFVYGE